MKKKFLALICAMIFVMSFTSCASIMIQVGEMLGDLDDSYQKEELPVEHTTDIEFEVPEEGKIHIKSYSVTDGYNDQKLLVLKLDYTNLTEDDQCSNNTLRYLNAYQDGALLELISSVYDKDYATQIKQGSTIEVVITLILRNTTSDINFELEYEDEVLSTHTLSMVSL